MPKGIYPRTRKVYSPASFWGAVTKTEGCWLWSGADNGNGYGTVYVNGRKTYAHRVSYEMAHGPIPVGLQIDHLCRVRNCVRPEHLEVVTPRENNLRGESPAAQQSRRTHCPQGHAYDETNTWVSKTGHRSCRTCTTERSRRQRANGYISPSRRGTAANGRQWVKR